MEDNEDAESTKSEVKLGKLQFSLDYDFQKGEVSGEGSANYLNACWGMLQENTKGAFSILNIQSVHHLCVPVYFFQTEQHHP